MEDQVKTQAYFDVLEGETKNYHFYVQLHFNNGYLEEFVLTYMDRGVMSFEIAKSSKNTIHVDYGLSYRKNSLRFEIIPPNDVDVLEEFNKTAISQYHDKIINRKLSKYDLKMITIKLIDYIDSELEHRIHGILIRLRRAVALSRD